jgi:hypothetical protein
LALVVRLRRYVSCAACVLIALSLTACRGSDGVEQVDRSPSPTPQPGQIGLEEPCPDGVTLALGAPFLGRDYAKFQTTGGTVYMSVGQVRDGGTRPTVYIGELARPPTYDPQSGRLRRVTATLPVVEQTWSAIDLDEGRYWLTVGGGWDLVIRSCEPGGIADASTFNGS